MSGFPRRYNFLPDPTELASIEGVVIIDRPPTAGIQGADSGTVFLAAETEDGGFATDPAQPVDVYHPRGGPTFIPRDGWVGAVGGFGHTVNGAKYQYPCARLAFGEYWNGNGYVQAKGLAFRRLYVLRADTSVGSVTFSPLAFLESSGAGPWALATGQTVVAQVDGAGAVTATFTGAAAQVTGAAAAFATLTAGEYVDISVDGAVAIRTTFSAGDTTIGAVVTRINAAFGFPVASNSTSQLRLTSSTGGTGSKVQVVGGSTGTVTKLGHAVGTTSGTGNVANIGAVTAAEAKTVMEAALTGTKVRLTDAGRIRLCSNTGSTGTIVVTGATTATAFGFATGTTSTASSGKVATTIPAGTVVSQTASAAATRCVTMQTLTIPAGTAVAVTVKVRPANDDGTFAALSANSLDQIETAPSALSEFKLSQPVALSAALTDAQKDAAYVAAIAVGKALSGPARKCNYVVSARQSPIVRAATLQNAKESSAVGHFGRKAYLSPPIGTSLATMEGSSDPGAGAYRHERAGYFPGWVKVITEIAYVGASGGAGYTDDGTAQVHGDIVAASIASVLNPEENIAQATDIIPTSYINVETALQSWGPDEYKRAKAAGVCAPFMDPSEGPQLMSGVTTVDPAAYPSQVPLSRVRLADFLTDSVAEFQGPFVKKLRTQARRDQLLGKLCEFLGGLQGAQRIAAWDAAEGVPTASRTHRLVWRAEPLPSMDVIVNETTIGEGAISTVRTSA